MERIHLPPNARAFIESIHPQLYGELAGLLLMVGLSIGLLFLRYETTATKAPGSQRSLLKEVLLAFAASNFLGFGVLFTLLWAEVYV